jgi:hypothetical protein
VFGVFQLKEIKLSFFDVDQQPKKWRPTKEEVFKLGLDNSYLKLYAKGQRYHKCNPFSHAYHVQQERACEFEKVECTKAQ